MLRRAVCGLFEAQLGVWGNAAVLAASLLVLAKASDVAVDNAVRVSAITGFSKTTIGFMLVGFSTSLPELFVSIFAALGYGSIGVAIGNVLGANVADVALILGLCFLIVAIECPRHTCFFVDILKEDVGSLYFGLFIASLIPLTLLYFGYASRLMGVILLAIFAYYMYRLSKVKTLKDEGPTNAEREKLPRYAALAVAGSVIVAVTAYFLVNSATYIANAVGIPGIVIGSTIVAFGTTSPELATSVQAVRKGHLNLALGNIVGSCFVNVTCILGVALTASPLNVNMAAFSNLAIFSLITNLFLWYFLSSEKLTWREGAVLLFIYAAFLATSFSYRRPL
jgi:cation:H+ antiporter